MTTDTRRRLRSHHVALGATLAAASMLSGCGASDPDYAAICVDPDTQERLDDDQCDDDDDPDQYNGSSPGFFWFYMASRSGYPVPPVGSRYNTAHGTYDGRSLASNGSYVQRGGLPSSGVSNISSFTKSGGFGSSKGVSSSGSRGGFGG